MGKEKQTKNRLELLDVIRGITLISMILYHTMFDVTFYTKNGLGWYLDTPGYVWQQTICWSFIFLSGMCRAIGKKSLKRGLIVSGCGLAITLVTAIFMPSERIIFGVLTFTGAAMLFCIPFEKVFRRINPYVGMAISALLFFLTRNVYFYHGLGFEGIKICRLPDFMYANYLTAFFGFPQKTFFSGDYFPFIPWIFLFLLGFFFWLAFGDRLKSTKLMHIDIKAFSFLGRHSLLIYMLHQPIAYGLVYLIFRVFT